MLIVKLKREYGKFLDKPNLPIGEYEAKIQGWSNGYQKVTGYTIIKDKHSYYVLSEDVEVNKTPEELKKLAFDTIYGS